ncbi:hypothetical protein [Prevotella sp. E13-27]|uniref:hypothetical protein n=1 Tax=Prevotella sp. E13-27 TaxID=2938122 RepID=UPI00200A4D37|nr:hypothetical protein [Prevotella sp. E13-27]MCK8621708.1 hypothetical protein [Prevotella sp. E13-27]
MKRFSFYIMVLLTTILTACDEDYSASIPPQSNPQESALQSGDITFNTNELSSINLAQLISSDTPIELGTVSITEGVMPSNTIIKARVDIAKASDFSDAYTLDAESMAASNIVSLLPSNLQAAYYNKFTHNPNQTKLYLRIHLYTVTNETSEAVVGTPGSNYYGNYCVTFTPANEQGTYISTGYYAVVKGLDSKWTETKFSHSEDDIYDDPVFTVTIDAIKNDVDVRQDTEFMIVAEEDLAKFLAGDMSVAFGQGEGEGMLKGGPAFVGPANDGAVRYELTMNMEKQSVVIEPVIQFYCYYLYTNTGGNMKVEAPETSRNYMFYKTAPTTFTYTTFWPNNNGGKSVYNAKVWEREAMLANATTKTWGFEGKATGARKESGTFAQPGQWLGPLTEGWFTLTIEMDEEKNIRTYQWTAAEAPTVEYTNISLIGTINGTNWDSDFDLTQCAKAPHNWCLLGFELSGDAKLKFRANHNWDTKDWGGDGSQPISQTVYTLSNGSSDITVPAGTYDFYLNDITGNWTILKVAK